MTRRVQGSPRLALALTGILCAIGGAVPGAPALAAQGKSVALTVGLGTVYDSNILQYSDLQLVDFELGLHPVRYAVETTDDGILAPSLALTGQIDEGHGRRHSLRLRYEGDFHGRNPTADMHSWSANWRESFRNDRQVSLGYYFMPRYYLRQLQDEDWTSVPASVRYRRAEFSLGILSATYGQRLGGDFLFDLGYQHEHRGYNPDFVERTSDLNQGRLGLTYDQLGRRGSLRGYGGYRDSKARGVDGDEIAGQPSDDQDVSYHGAVAGLGVRYEFARSGPWRWGGDLGYEFEERDYTSPNSFDKYHYGRHDQFQAVELGLRSALRPHLSMRASYRHENNAAHLGALAPPSTDTGSYHGHLFGLSFEWTGDL
jgi:hypothetical protein